MSTWIKLHRQLLHSEVFQNDKLLRVWIWCLLKASWKEHDQIVGRQMVHLKPGQFIYGRKMASRELGYPESTTRDVMDLLKRMGNIDIKSTNKYSVVTICQWELYQSKDEKSDNRQTAETPADTTAKGQQIDTNKKDKKYKKDIDIYSAKKDSIDSIPYQAIVDQYNELCKSLPKVIKLTDKRRTAIRARWKEYKDIEIFRTMFEKAEASDFLTGRSSKWRVPGFDWLMEPSNMVKILEGSYDNQKSIQQPKRSVGPRWDLYVSAEENR